MTTDEILAWKWANHPIITYHPEGFVHISTEEHAGARGRDEEEAIQHFIGQRQQIDEYRARRPPRQESAA